jgi:hypothetical protein
MSRLKKDTFITVESDDQPGVLRKYLVYDVRPDNYVKLIYQDDVESTPDRQQLVDYMKENSITPLILASILGRSRATVYRYMSGAREIPAEVFRRLGLPQHTHMKTEQIIEQLRIELSGLRDRLDSIVKKFDQ